MDNKKPKLKKSDLSITVLLIIGILATVNFFSYDIFYRADLTQNKVYSISDASKRAVGELEDIVNIKAYFSGKLPSQLLTLRQEVEDTLGEYVAYSGGKIRLEIIDPDTDDKLKQELQFKGIPELTFEVVEKDKRELVKGYLGLVISFGDKVETIPALKQDTRNLEYQLTTKIKKVVSAETPTVAFLTSQGAADMEKDLSAVKESLSELYAIKEIKLEEKDPKIDEEIDTLIIVGPKEKFNEDQLKAINSFFSRGKSLIALYDGVKIGDGLNASANESGLDTLLAKYGITVNKDLVADSQSGMASFSQGFFSFSTPYPFWPKITGTGFDQEYSAVSSLENVVLPWASTLTLDDAKFGNAKVSKLLNSGTRSWTQSGQFSIMPNQPLTPSSELKERLLAVAVLGELDNPYPKGGDSNKFPAKLIVVGDSDFAFNGFVANNPDNLNLMLNLVDSVSLDSDLIEIRSKDVSSRPLDEDLNDAKRMSLRYFNVFGITAIVIAFGVARYFMRRKSRFADEL